MIVTSAKKNEAVFVCFLILCKCEKYSISGDLEICTVSKAGDRIQNAYAFSFVS